MSDPANPAPTPPAAPAPTPAPPPAATPAPAAAAPAAKPAPAPVVKPPMPGKPAPAGKAVEERRGVIAGLIGVLTSPLVIAWGSFVAASTAMTLGTTRFLFPNVLVEPPNKVRVGEPGSFEDGKVYEQFKDRNIWVVRSQGTIFALSTTCTHLGCTPNWQEADKKFKCPCHGSGFYISGVNFEGPAPRPLERWAIGVGDDGALVVDKGKKFQEELGQWENPESFFKV